jgi:hypothetical protein
VKKASFDLMRKIEIWMKSVARRRMKRGQPDMIFIALAINKFNLNSDQRRQLHLQLDIIYGGDYAAPLDQFILFQVVLEKKTGIRCCLCDGYSRGNAIAPFRWGQACGMYELIRK